MGTLDILLTGAVFLSTLFCLFLLMLPSQYQGKSSRASSGLLSQAQAGNGGSSREGNAKTSIQILVLGDIGRSPRMQYHAISAGKHGVQVDLIGYRESDPHPDVLAEPNIKIIPIPASPAALQTGNKILFLICGPLKVLWQMWHLLRILGYRTQPVRWLLVQNPPSIPTLAVAHAICFLRNTHLIIDWHNFGWTILALKLGQEHPLVRIAGRYEQLFGRFATANFTVTDAMARTLKQKYHVRSPILTLHDRPAHHFQPLSSEERATFLKNCPLTTDHAPSILSGETRLLVSSTSWTPDEDFSLLLDALVLYSANAKTAGDALPHLLVVITGKGPQKPHYLQTISTLRAQGKLDKVTVLTAWLSISDYASLLGSADLGVSLHVSSSGLDLPMKVVDMFGTGLPVVGWNKFEAWSELVKEGVNGQGFADAGELGEVLLELFRHGNKKLGRLRHGALLDGEKRWEHEWDPVAGKLFGLYD